MIVVNYYQDEDFSKEGKAKDSLTTYNSRGSLLVIGCNYHTSWQSHKAMRFILIEIKGSKARLNTRKSNRDFWTNVDDLIFIESNHNKKKAFLLRETD